MVSFGVVSTGTVKNLTVSGAVTISGSGYSSYGIAAIAGSLNQYRHYRKLH